MEVAGEGHRRHEGINNDSIQQYWQLPEPNVVLEGQVDDGPRGREVA